MTSSLVDFERLDRISNQAAQAYESASPFPHIVIDHAFPKETMRLLLQEFPPPDAPLAWRKREIVSADGRVNQARKLGFSDEYMLGPHLRQLFHELNSGKFLALMERLAGISRLLPDPSLQGAGIHIYLSGAVLNPHADFTIHPVFKYQRRLNLLLYLNDDWDPAWGGDLELWTPDMQRCQKRIPPTANRMVVFSTNDTSFHGMSAMTHCPPYVLRRSIVLYYYSVIPSDAERERLTAATKWQREPASDDPA